MALALTYAGAAGDTRAQMAQTLHYGAIDVPQAFSSLQKQIQESVDRTASLAKARGFGQKIEPITLSIANRLFGQTGYDFRQSYMAFVKDRYNAPLEQLDFQTNPSTARKTINLWVEKQTQKRIVDLIPAGGLDGSCRLVLANALYFKASWSTKFEKSATKPFPFHAAPGKDLNIPTMVHQGYYGYRHADGFTAVSIPYVGEEFQFLILLPDSKESPALKESALSSLANLESKEVRLYLPKFKLEPPSISLGDALKKLGMPSAFNVPQGSANFDGIAARKPDDYLYISNVFHKTFLAVDEDGTEAAAATAVVMATFGMAVPHQPIEVRVDRPFLFAIQHRPTGACLFLGQIVNPEK